MFELRVICPETGVAPISDALEALGAASISTADAEAGSADEAALFGEPGLPVERDAWPSTVVSALFESEGAARHAAAILEPQDFFAQSRVVGVQPVPERDWVRITQAQFEPVAITPGFWIVPSWHQAPAGAERVIHLDPGLAFGTGTHPTTRMCLQWIATHARAAGAPRVLDYGCGSGILAIAARLFGAAEVDAVDIDPVAVDAAAANAKANHAAVRTGTPERANGLYDVVLANILAQPLKVLASLLCAHVAPGGSLVLAGILERQVAELQDAYRPWLTLAVSNRESGWVLLTANKT